MDPTKTDQGAIELVDVLLRDGAVIAADAVVTVAGIPLIGIQLRLAIAGMTEMIDQDVFTEWDESIREQASSGRES